MCVHIWTLTLRNFVPHKQCSALPLNCTLITDTVYTNNCFLWLVLHVDIPDYSASPLLNRHLGVSLFCIYFSKFLPVLSLGKEPTSRMVSQRRDCQLIFYTIFNLNLFFFFFQPFYSIICVFSIPQTTSMLNFWIFKIFLFWTR